MLRRRGAIEARRVDGGQLRELPGRRRLEVRRHREQVFEPRRIQEPDLRAALRGLAHAVREHRRFTAQVGADDQQRMELIDVGDGQPPRPGAAGSSAWSRKSAWRRRWSMLRRAERARELRSEIEFFHGRRAAGEHREPRRRAAFKPLAAVSSAASQLTLLPLAAPRAPSASRRSGAIDAFVAVAVAVGDPGLVDGVVLPRHHAHELAAQHVAEEIGAQAVMRRHQRAPGSFPRRARESGTACC